jgi:hypothetical protein
MFLTHGKKRRSDDVGDSPIGSTGFRGGTDSNIFLNKEGARRVISTEQRWGTAMEPTLLVFDDERQVMELGVSLEEEQHGRQEAKDSKTIHRIQKEIWAGLRELSNPTQQELLGLVKGKNTTKLSVLKDMVGSGSVKEEAEGRSIRYRGNMSLEQPSITSDLRHTSHMEAFVERFE